MPIPSDATNPRQGLCGGSRADNTRCGRPIHQDPTTGLWLNDADNSPHTCAEPARRTRPDRDNQTTKDRRRPGVLTDLEEQILTRAEQPELTEAEWKTAYAIVEDWNADYTVKDWLRMLLEIVGPNWMRGVIREAGLDEDDPEPTPPQIDWYQCGNCGWQRGVMRDGTRMGSTIPMTFCPRCCGPDAWEPTQVQTLDIPATMVVGDYIDEPEQVPDWRIKVQEGEDQ